MSQEDDIQDSDGDGVIDSEDYAPSDPEVQKKSDVQSGGGSSSQEVNTPTEADTPTEVDTPTEKPNNTQLAEQAAAAYEKGLNDSNSADETGDRAVNFFESDDYIAAAEQYEEAADVAMNAKNHFSSAADFADETSNKQGAVNLAEEASRRSELASQIASESAKWSRDAKKYGENSDEVDEHRQRVEDLQTRAENYDIGTLNEFKIALGIT
ncbi:hypothetical protein [Halorientalis persicus]|uniref:hypothetical protein n=1 Tax=Halorientalis persicus TaxID=1367881 RepID=UPI001B8D5D22|nr:hypothetical protein [Halorientalis persicus]